MHDPWGNEFCVLDTSFPTSWKAVGPGRTSTHEVPFEVPCGPVTTFSTKSFKGRTFGAPGLTAWT